MHFKVLEGHDPGDVPPIGLAPSDPEHVVGEGLSEDEILDLRLLIQLFWRGGRDLQLGTESEEIIAICTLFCRDQNVKKVAFSSSDSPIDGSQG